MATRAKRRTSSKTKSRYNEIVAIILTALAVLILLSLVTANPSDPSLVTSSSQTTQNWVGFVGANIAALLFNLVGVLAYLVPFLILLIAVKIFGSRTPFIPVSRLLGFLLFVVSGAGLATLLFSDVSIIGEASAQFFTYLIGTIGAGVLLSAFFLASILLITNLSYASFLDSFRMAWANFKVHLGEWTAKYKRMREENAAPASRANRARTTKKKPTISTGSTNGDTLTGKIGAAVSRLGEPPGGSDETAKIPTSPPSIEKAVQELKDLSNKENGGDKAALPLVPATASVETNTKPTPTPAAQTGDLAKGTAAATAPTKEEKKAESKPKPRQNFENYELPKFEYLKQPPEIVRDDNDKELHANARHLEETAEEFNVKGEVKHINLGPVVTTYEFKPDPGVKYARVTGLADDLCLALKAESIRIERIPGKAVVGMEIPNEERETIFLRDVIDSKEFKESESKLTVALGKVIDGHRQVADLAKMPHLLIAGATGAGKSVGVNSLIVSILYKARPDEVKFIMVDPKRLELGVYADIPHLATPIITDPKRAAISLKWAVAEMERRYKDLAGWGVRNIDGYNKEVVRRNKIGERDEEGNKFGKLPYIVIIIDELADLMMVSGKEVEESITRLAQMARAVGIHLVLATQRPSVDVITGLIKANFPSRISFRVSSKIDSRTIIDANGAERLLGRGDMLFLPPGTSHLIRVHGAYVDETEIHKIVEHIKSQGNPEYDETITKSEEEMDEFGDLPGRKDDLFGDALKTVVSAKRASTSLLQRHLRIGYGRAAAILDALVADGFIGEMDGSKRARPVTEKAYEAVQEMEEGREL